MFLRVMTQVPLHEPDDDAGFVTTLVIEIVEVLEVDQQEREVRAGTAEAVVLHAGLAGPRMWEAAEAQELADVYTTYYAPVEARFRDELDLCGCELDLLYIVALELDPIYLGRGVELAVAARLRDAFCAGVGIMAVRAASEEAAEGWASMGFVCTDVAETTGLMHLDTGRRTPRVVDELRDDDRMAFKVLPQPNPLRLAEMH